MRSVGGMRNFFGSKLGRHVTNAFAHLSPVNVGMGPVRQRIDAAFASEGMIGAAKIAGQRIKRGLASAGRKNYSFGDWMSGLNVGETAESVGVGLRQTRAAWRVGSGVTFGVAALSGAIAPGNPLDVTARSAIQLGGHTAVTAALGSVNPTAGMAYAGLAGLNLVRRGNNFGPF